MRLLLKLGADYNSKLAYFNQAPLSCVLACLGQDCLLKELVQHLSRASGGPQYKFSFSSHLLCCDDNRTNLLSYATQHNQLECCRFILTNSHDPIDMLTRPDSAGYCAFTYVVAISKNDMIDLLEFYIKFLLAWSGSGARCEDEAVRKRKIELLEQAIVLSAANSNPNCLNYLIDLCILNKYNHLY